MRKSFRFTLGAGLAALSMLAIEPTLATQPDGRLPVLEAALEVEAPSAVTSCLKEIRARIGASVSAQMPEPNVAWCITGCTNTFVEELDDGVDPATALDRLFRCKSKCIEMAEGEGGGGTE